MLVHWQLKANHFILMLVEGQEKVTYQLNKHANPGSVLSEQLSSSVQEMKTKAAK